MLLSWAPFFLSEGGWRGQVLLGVCFFFVPRFGLFASLGFSVPRKSIVSLFCFILRPGGIYCDHKVFFGPAPGYFLRPLLFTVFPSPVASCMSLISWLKKSSASTDDNDIPSNLLSRVE